MIMDITNTYVIRNTWSKNTNLFSEGRIFTSKEDAETYIETVKNEVTKKTTELNSLGAQITVNISPEIITLAEFLTLYAEANYYEGRG